MQELVPPETELRCQPNCVVEFSDPAEKILDMGGTRPTSLVVGRLGPGRKEK
jgi:hypothetical protein